MKDFLKKIGIIAFVAVIGFAMAACEEPGGTGSGGNPSGNGTFSRPYALTEGVWTNGSIDKANQEVWYFFDASPYSTYYLWFNDYWSGDGTKTLDISLRVTFPDGTISDEADGSWDGYKIIVSRSGTLKIRVRAYDGGSDTGTFGIAYTIGSSSKRPSTGDDIETGTPYAPYKLSAGIWADGSIEDAYQELWYKFDVTAGIEYYLWLNDGNKGNGTKTLDTGLRIYLPNGLVTYELANDEENDFWNGFSAAFPSSGTIRICVRSYDGGEDTGTFGIAYTIANSERPTIAPIAPTDVGIMTISSRRIVLSWTSVPDATRYYIYRSTDPDGTFTEIGNTNNTTYDNTELLPETTYYYKVAAYNSAGTGPQSSYASATTKADPVITSAPAGVSATVSSSSYIIISWNIVSDAIGYYVYRSTESADNYTLVEDTTSRIISDSGLLPETTYYYKVAAYNSSGTGPESSEVSATTKSWITPSSPSALSAGVWKNGSMTTSEREVWYSFDVTSGTTYYLWWNDSYQGNNTKSLDIRVSAYNSSGISYIDSIDSAWNAPQSFTASSSDTVYIQITKRGSSSSSGSFGVVYSTSNTRP